MRKIFLLFAAWVIIYPSSLSAEAPSESSAPPLFIFTDSIWKMNRFGTFQDYWNFIHNQGYTGVDLKIVDSEGSFFFYSPVLENLGWNQGTDYLTDFVKFWEKEKKSKDRKSTITLNFSALSQRKLEISGMFNPKVDRPSSKDIEDFLFSFLQYYELFDLTSESYDMETQSILHLGVSAIKRKLNMLLSTPSFDNLLVTPDFEDKREVKEFDRIVTGDLFPYPLKKELQTVFPSIGLGDVGIAIARASNKEVWVGNGTGEGGSDAGGFPQFSEHNVFLYRAAQYAPEGYVVLPTMGNSYINLPDQFNFEKEIKKDLLNYHAIFKKLLVARRPIANLVLSHHSQEFSGIHLAHYVEPIMNALLSNGYEVKVTFGHFIKGAELYYVVSNNDWLKSTPSFEELMQLLDHKKSRFYGTVILHPLDEIQNSARWKKIREIFKIPPTEKGWINDIPYNVQLKGHKILWKGNSASEHFGMSRIRAEEVHNHYGEVILSEVFDKDTLALILRSGNHFLVNGNILHFQSSYFLSKLMGGALQMPVLAYVTSDRNRTAALAIANTRLRLKIPSPEIADEWRILLFDEKGQMVRDEVVKGQEIFEISLKPYELVFLECRYK